MPWVKTEDVDPPPTDGELAELAKGHSILRELPDGILVGCPRVIIIRGERKAVTGEGITYGPNGESFFFHRGGRLERR